MDEANMTAELDPDLSLSQIRPIPSKAEMEEEAHDGSIIIEDAVMDVDEPEKEAQTEQIPQGNTRPSNDGTRAMSQNTPNPKGKETTSNDPLIGKTIGGCKILEVLGRGAMGAVYKARQISLDRIVALKTIREDFCNDENFLSRFQHEAKTVGRFNTPYVVQIHEVGYDQDIHFIVMEYVSGGNMMDYVNDSEGKRLTIEDTLRFMREIAEGLSEAERLNIVHRDIKPENLLLDQSGHIKIADFGISKVLGATIQMTASPSILGTPLYMSPEQAQGKDLDHRSDMYSVGATFYHLLTGAPPVTGESVYDLIQKKVEIDYLSPRQIVEDESVPDYVSRIIEKMTALYPDYRYQSFKDVLNDLDRVQAGQAPQAKTPVQKSGGGAFSKVAALIVLAGLGVGGYFLYEKVIKEKIYPPNNDGKIVINKGKNSNPNKNNNNSNNSKNNTDPNNNSDSSNNTDHNNNNSTNPKINTVTFDYAGHQAKLNAIREKFSLQPDFKLLDSLASFNEGLLTDIDLIKQVDATKVPQEATDLQSQASLLKNEIIEKTIEKTQTTLMELKKDFVGGPSETLKLKLSNLNSAIPEETVVPEVSNVKFLVNSVLEDVDNGLKIRDQLKILREVEKAGFEPPYESAEKHFANLKVPLVALDRFGDELKAWLNDTKNKESLRLAKVLEPTVIRQVQTIEALEESYRENKTSIEKLSSSLRLLKNSKSTLLNSGVGTPSRWNEVIPEAVISKIEKTIANAESMVSQISGEAQKADDVLRELKRVKSLVDWSRMLAAQTGEIERLASFAKENEKAGVEPLTQVLSQIEALKNNWKVQSDRFILNLNNLANRKISSAESLRSFEELLNAPLSRTDRSVSSLQAAWRNLNDGYGDLLRKLDLIRADQHFQDAQSALDELRQLERELTFKSAISNARQTVNKIIEKQAELRALTDKMAPVPGGKVVTPVAEGKEEIVESFFIDRYEVTVREYKEFMKFLQGKTFDQVKSLWLDQSGFERGKRTPPSLEEKRVENDWPIESINYHQALAYSRWRNKDLFTVQEWFLAAKGPAILGKHRDSICSDIDLSWKENKPTSVKVGGLVLGFTPRNSVHHLAGNVAEWCKAPEGEERAYVAGGRYRDGKREYKYFKGERIPRERLSEIRSGYGFRSVLRVKEFFKDLLPE